MGRPLSLALRLTLLFSTTAAGIFALFGWFIVESTKKHFEEGDRAELTVIAGAVESALADADTPTPAGLRFEDILVGHHRASLYILGADKRVIHASPGPDLAALAAGQSPDDGDSELLLSESGHNYRVLLRRLQSDADVDSPSPVMAIAVQTDYHRSFLGHFHRLLWTMIAASVVVMSAMGWFAVRTGIAPLHEMVGKIRRISARELDTRLSPETVPRELQDLAASFNEMLQRVESAFQRLSQYDADIAHELRTPITSLMTQTEVALSRSRSLHEYREILYSNMEEYARMAQMIGDMLFLAQTSGSPQAETVAGVDLAGEVRALFEYYEGWADENHVALVLEGTAGTRGDRPMLRRALGNLVSNAIRHTPAGGTVRVALATSSDGMVSVLVENPGDDIPPEHIPRLFDRFYRVDPSRQRTDSGTGLGLAIVKSIVAAHGGNIEVVSGGGWTRFTIILPGPER